MNEQSPCDCEAGSHTLSIRNLDIIKLMFAPSCLAIVFCLSMLPNGDLLGLSLVCSLLLAATSTLSSIKHIFTVLGVIQMCLFAIFNTVIIQSFYYYIKIMTVDVESRADLLAPGGFESSIMFAVTLFSLGIFTLSLMHKAPVFNIKIPRVLSLVIIALSSMLIGNQTSNMMNEYVVTNGLNKVTTEQAITTDDTVTVEAELNTEGEIKKKEDEILKRLQAIEAIIAKADKLEQSVKVKPVDHTLSNESIKDDELINEQVEADISVSNESTDENRSPTNITEAVVDALSNSTSDDVK
ncbi:hypothetical protein LMH73_007905 [Vibrio splendidus]|nr:hypothetical protein [Vibrio splendidus]MCC4883113.1 hypothetical protein [Vibrio splendidus]